MTKRQREAEGIALYIQYLEAEAARERAAATRLLQASADLGEPMALHAAAFREPRTEVALLLYAAAADAGFAASAWNLYLHYIDAGDAEATALWLKRAASLGDEDAIRLTGLQSG